ncbi:hypothetical protein [Streptomyces sp. DSM 41534]
MVEAMTRIWVRAQLIAEAGRGDAHAVRCSPSALRHSHQKPGVVLIGTGTAMVAQVLLPSSVVPQSSARASTRS